MANSSAFDTSPVTVGDRPNAALIAEEIKNNAPNWAEAMKIPFWKALSKQTTKDNAYKSVEEFFARKKIKPSWIKLDRLCEGQMCGFFGYKGCLLSKLWDTVQEVHKFLNTVSEEVSRPDKSAKEVRQALSEHVEMLVPPLLLDLFPHDFEWHLQSLYMDLATPNNTEVLSSIFYRYFKYSFPFTSNKSMCFPTQALAEDQGPDLELYAEEGKNNTIFLVCEYEDVEHKNLLKLMDTLQSVILQRVQQYPSASNNALGVLCRGNKMTMFLMLYNQTSNDFTCSFLAENQTDLYTALIDLENISTLLHCNIVIMIAGKTLYLGPSQCHDTDLNNNEKNQNTKDEKEEERHQQGGIFEKLVSDKLQQHKYIVQEMLSTKVYQVYFNDQDYVAKFYFTSEAKSREELILEKLSDKFLKPVDSFKISDEIRCVIFPYIENCSWLKRHEFVEDARSVLLALAELHEKKIVHCDVKYSNVVFGEEGTYLIDFDLALENPGRNQGTFGYGAPETKQCGELSYKSDIYSFGVFLFELARRCELYDMDEHLYNTTDERTMARNIRIAIKKLAFRSPWHAEIVALIEKCMNEDPNLRPSAKELLAEPFLALNNQKARFH